MLYKKFNYNRKNKVIYLSIMTTMTYDAILAESLGLDEGNHKRENMPCALSTMSDRRNSNINIRQYHIRCDLNVSN